MLGEILSPGVQDRRAPEVAAEMARIAPEGGEGVGGRPEEQRVEDAGIALGERVERMRQREDHMEVLDGQQFRAAGVEPADLGEGLALGTVAVAAGVVADLHGAAGVTRVAMAAERGGPTRLDGVHGAALGAGERVGLPIRRPVGAEDLGELYADPRPARGARAGAGGMGQSTPGGLGRSRGEWVPVMRSWLRWKYRMVVEMCWWPSWCCTVARSAVWASSECVAKA